MEEIHNIFSAAKAPVLMLLYSKIIQEQYKTIL